MDQKVSSQTNVFVYKKQQSSTDIGSSKFFVDLIKKTIHKGFFYIKLIKYQYYKIYKDKNVATNLNNPNYKIINENQFVISDYCKICSTKLNGLNLEIRHQWYKK